jgi:hypothetical protein
MRTHGRGAMTKLLSFLMAQDQSSSWKWLFSVIKLI